MRIPFPERVNLNHALLFAAGFCAIQLFEGTDPFFAGCVFCFLLVAAVGFNIAGGLPYPSGAYIGFNTIFTVILPMTVKIILREPADSNLRAPQRMMEVYLLGMVTMMAAAIFSRRFRPRKAYISGMLPAGSLRSAYIGCAVLSVILTFYLVFFGKGGNGSFDSFLVQANRFPVLTFILGIIYTMHRSGGRRSMSLPLFGMIMVMALGALLTFSKEQFLTPFFVWVITAALMGYRLHWLNFACLGIGLYFVVSIFYPYAQYGRGFQTNISRVQLSAYLLTHLDEVHEGYDETKLTLGNVHYYNRPLSLLDRLDFTSGDSALVAVTDRDGAYGYEPMREGFVNIIPHVLYPGKPIPFFGNVYGHQIGVLAYDDFITSVSFSPSADAYRQGGVYGVVVVETAVLMLVFLILDSVIGDVRRNPVGLLTTVLVSRASVEGMLWSTPLLIGQYLFTNVLAAYICAYVLPMLGSIFNKQVFHTAETFLLQRDEPSSHPPPIRPVSL